MAALRAGLSVINETFLLVVEFLEKFASTNAEHFVKILQTSRP